MLSYFYAFVPGLARFSNLSNLRKHLSLHERDKTRPCPACGEGFATARALAEHGKNAHAGFYPSFQCPKCEDKFYAR